MPRIAEEIRNCVRVNIPRDRLNRNALYISDQNPSLTPFEDFSFRLKSREKYPSLVELHVWTDENGQQQAYPAQNELLKLYPSKEDKSVFLQLFHCDFRLSSPDVI